MSGNPVSKRRQFGEALAFLRGEMSLSKHSLADKTRMTTKIVESWEAGEVVPTVQEWQRMRAIFPAMSSAGSRYGELFRAAAAEQARAAKAEEGDDFAAAVRLVLEAKPNLRSATIDVDDDGEVSVSYKTREVRVVEEGGTLKVRSR